MRYFKTPLSGDPSDVIQNFQKVRLDIHCCRYWWLKHWKHQRLSFPFWRLYWNKNEGAYVSYEGKLMLNPGRIILIPPNTPFSTDISGDQEDSITESNLEGGWISTNELELNSIKNGRILHFFIHFNLGYPFDNISPGIYHLDVSSDQLSMIKRITDILKKGISDFAFKECLDIYQLILSSVSSLQSNLWQSPSVDSKIIEVMSYMNRNLGNKLPNEILASTIRMSTNSFARLFKQQTGLSPQKYLTKTRIENSCNLMHHSTLSINEIAEKNGFSDRYYFTKVFSSIMKVPPAHYRKQVLIKKI